ncbi:hypothetical protein FB45DRAFT_1019219 [Roridomyces roridus]|uniref:BTB domain-containing protein n=1 Tax=Roridomyces roridus TaxID=1738132 RepID=A0AAD7BXB0_9AGAR|nr:hypothetical protein FB45DRAFT_866529 [Roridomyces roridus]KAJ7646579.1 hypothetical protein FB45DRAFT_860071 [Roridomyces roridus]KAJ7646937.1 hypothetical protein FB45DRAFT_1019219 [Roridomyces roridus]
MSTKSQNNAATQQNVTLQQDAGSSDMNKIEKNEGQWLQHADHWYADGSLVLRVNKSLYKVHEGVLTRLAPNFFGGILSIPDGKEPGDPTREGTELFPLLLEGVDIQRFEDFLAWNYHSVPKTVLDDPFQKRRFFMNLLAISDMWQIDTGRDTAITELEKMALSPVERLELAVKYSVPHWVDEAVKDIFAAKVTSLKDEDIARLDCKVYSVLVKGAFMIETEIRRTAQVEPATERDPDWRCMDHAKCCATWKRVWWEVIGRKLLHPDIPISTDDIHWEVKKIHHKDISPQCMKDMVTEIESIVFVDKRIIAGVIEAILEFMGVGR